MKYYIIQSFHLPFIREWDIYENWLSVDKLNLIERVREDLEKNVLFESVTLTESEDGFLNVNNNQEKWLKVLELKVV